MDINGNSLPSMALYCPQWPSMVFNGVPGPVMALNFVPKPSMVLHPQDPQDPHDSQDPQDQYGEKFLPVHFGWFGIFWFKSNIHVKTV